MDTFYNLGSGLTDIAATSVQTDTLVCDDINSQSGIINLNFSSLSNVQNVYANGNVFATNITTLSNAVNVLSNTFIEYSNVQWKFNNSNVYLLQSSNVCIGTSNATQQLTLTGGIQASNLHTSNLIVYRGSNVLDTDGKIDFTWIKNSPPFSIKEDNTLELTALSIASGAAATAAAALAIAGRNLFDPVGRVGPDLLDNLKDLTGDIPDANEETEPDADSNVSPHWNAITWKPLYYNPYKLDVGFSSNVFFNRNSAICTINPTTDYTKLMLGKYKYLNAPYFSSNVIIDLANLSMTMCNITASNINTFRTTSTNLTSTNATISSMTASSIFSSNATIPNLITSNLSLSNLSVPFITSSNMLTSNLTSSQLITACNIQAWNIQSSNVSSSNIFASNLDTRTTTSIIAQTSNMTACNVACSNVNASNINTNFLMSKTFQSENAFIDTLYSLSNVYGSNISSCNINQLSNDYHAYSNMGWRFNDSNIYTGLAQRVVAIGQCNATEKLDVLGNVKASGGMFGRMTISSNLLGVNSVSVSNQRLFRNDGEIDRDLLDNINNLAGNSNGVDDNYNPALRSSNLFMHYNNLVWSPVYTDSNFNWAFSSNVFFNTNTQLCRMNPVWDYTKVNGGRNKTFNYPFTSCNVVIDFSTLSATFCNLTTSNITNVATMNTSNVITSNVTTSNLSANSITSRTANLSNLWASNVGINQVNPLYNLDVNGGARIQQNIIVNGDVICASNITSSNLTTNFNLTTSNLFVQNNAGIGLTNPTYKLDVSGASRISTTSLGVGFIVQNSGLTTGTTQNLALTIGKALSTNNTANFRYTHRGGDGSTSNYVGIGFWGNDDILNVQTNGNVGIGTTTPSQVLDVRGNGLFSNVYSLCNIGIGTSNPNHRLDITSTNGATMNLQGGVGSNPTILYLNSTNAGNTTSQIRFVNLGNSITCTDSNLYNGWASASSSGHRIYYSSGSHNFQGTIYSSNNVGIGLSNPTRPLDVNGLSLLRGGVEINGINTIEFGRDVAGKQTDAGKIGYGTFTSGSLDIVGAGTAAGSRGVRLWDNVSIANNLSVGGGLSVGGSGTNFQNMIFGYSNIGTDPDRFSAIDLTYALGGPGAIFSVFPSIQQASSTVDAFSTKWIQTGAGGSLNNIQIQVYRNDQSGWGSAVTIHWMIVRF